MIMPIIIKFQSDLQQASLLKGNEDVIARLHLEENEKEMIEHIILQMEKESGMDREAALAKMRFTFIDKICKTQW